MPKPQFIRSVIPNDDKFIKLIKSCGITTLQEYVEYIYSKGWNMNTQTLTDFLINEKGMNHKIREI